MLIKVCFGILCLTYYTTALKQLLPKHGLYKGDVLIMAVFPVHYSSLLKTDKSGSSRCSKLGNDVGIQGIEALVYFLDEINHESKLLNGFTLGALLLDSCSDETYMLMQAISVIRVMVQKSTENLYS